MNPDPVANPHYTPNLDLNNDSGIYMNPSPVLVPDSVINCNLIHVCIQIAILI
jgi:hypothetical protein